MGAVGAFLIVVAFVLGIITIIHMLKDDWDLALLNMLLCLLLVVIGVLTIRTYGTYKNEKEDDDYVTIVTSDYKVLDQSQIYITGEDTVVYKKYIIKYKK